MPMQSRSLPAFQRDILQNALRTKNREIWLLKEAAITLPTTYSALVQLQKRKLIELVPMDAQEVVRWKVTKTGREVVAETEKKARQAEQLARRPSKPGVAVASASVGPGRSLTKAKKLARRAR